MIPITAIQSVAALRALADSMIIEFYYSEDEHEIRLVEVVDGFLDGGEGYALPFGFPAIDTSPYPVMLVLVTRGEWKRYQDGDFSMPDSWGPLKKLSKIFKISHRGNISGQNVERENSPLFIKEALEKGFSVEVDVWNKDGELSLGHDEPKYLIEKEFLINPMIWVHCKNVEAVESLKYSGVHYFWHQSDDITLTSKSFIWTYPGKSIIPGAIAVLPERHWDWDISKAGGICSDYISNY